jgi:hypothetical protein
MGIHTVFCSTSCRTVPSQSTDNDSNGRTLWFASHRQRNGKNVKAKDKDDKGRTQRGRQCPASSLENGAGCENTQRKKQEVKEGMEHHDRERGELGGTIGRQSPPISVHSSVRVR